MKEFAQLFVCVITLFFAHCAQAQVWFQDDFESNTTVNTAAFPTELPPTPAGDFDPDAPAVGTWTMQENFNGELGQVSSFTTTDPLVLQPGSAHSGNNYLISGHNCDILGTSGITCGNARGLATANLSGGAVTQARVDFWMWQEPWTLNTQYGVVQGRLTGAGGGRAWELTFENNERVKWNSLGGGGGVTLPAELLLIENAWNHIVVDYDSGAGEFGEAIITINDVPSEPQPTLSGLNPVNPNSFDTILFRPEHRGFYDDILVSTVSVVDGDYNGNGIVDAADYVLWRDNVGQPKGTLPNDSSSDDPIGNSQYTLWSSRFGSTSGSGSSLGGAAAVPEPSLLAMVGLLLPVALWSQRSRRSKGQTANRKEQYCDR